MLFRGLLGSFFQTANTIMETFIHWLAFTFSAIYGLWTQVKKLAYITGDMSAYTQSERTDCM